MSNESTIKVVFGPGVLEELENTMAPDELQEFLDQLKEAAESGTLFEDSNLVDMDELALEDPELYASLVSKVDEWEKCNTGTSPVLH